METSHALGARKNKPNQSQFDGLSFLRKQESRLLDGSGFRIKCGMTAVKARSEEHDYAEQTQFAKSQSECKLFFDKALWK